MLPNWSGAHCIGLDPGLFFPEPPTTPDDVARAKAVCESCPHREPCLELALETNAPGIWGGTSDKERRRIRKQRKAVAA